MRHVSAGIVDNSQVAYLLAYLRYLGRQLRRSRGCLATPEGNVGRGPLGILHQQASRIALYAADAPGTVPKEEDVSPHALHSKVFIDCPHDRAVRLCHDIVKRTFGNSAAVRNGHQPAAAAATQPVMHAVAVEMGRVTAAASRDSLRENFHKCVKVRTKYLAIGIRAAHNLEEAVLIPLFAGAHGHDLLGQNVQRSLGNLELIELTLPDSPN